MGNLNIDSDDWMKEVAGNDSIECGQDALKHFDFDKDFRNLNHGSFGTYPSAIRPILRRFQDRCEARPDEFIRYTFPQGLDVSRKAISEYLNVPIETCVFVPNATTGVNTVLRNLVYQPGDVIIYFATIYGACEKTIRYLEETTPLRSRKIAYTYPVSDDILCSRFESAIADVRAQGQNPRVALFDTITSLPGTRMPFERLAALCRHHGILSCIDGAHSVGQIPLDLAAVDPDFFVSNCHKWLLVPRGCAVFYVPVRHQPLIRSTLPTSHGFVPRDDADGKIKNPLPPNGKSVFVNNFEFVGTLDGSPYLCVPAALRWRSRVTFEGKRGEEAIFEYSHRLARDAGDVVARVLGTEVLEDPARPGGACTFANVRLPLSFDRLAGGEFDTAMQIGRWVSVTLKEYGTFMALLVYNDAWWVRLSATIYLTIEDFEWAGKTLKEVCGRVEKGEWKTE